MSTKSPINILLVDDHPVTRSGIRALLETNPDFQIVAEAGNAEEALNYAQELEVDLALVDIRLEHSALNGIDLTAKLKKEFPQILVLIISMHTNGEYAKRAMKSGARGYISKSAEAKEFNKAIREVISGRTYIDPDLIKGIMPLMEESEIFLTDRQREVLWHIGDCKSSKDIAGILDTTMENIKTHRREIRERLNAKSAKLMKIAIKYSERHSKPPDNNKEHRDELNDYSD